MAKIINIADYRGKYELKSRITIAREQAWRERVRLTQDRVRAIKSQRQSRLAND